MVTAPYLAARQVAPGRQSPDQHHYHQVNHVHRCPTLTCIWPFALATHSQAEQQHSVNESPNKHRVDRYDMSVAAINHHCLGPKPSPLHTQSTRPLAAQHCAGTARSTADQQGTASSRSTNPLRAHSHVALLAAQAWLKHPSTSTYAPICRSMLWPGPHRRLAASIHLPCSADVTPSCTLGSPSWQAHHSIVAIRLTLLSHHPPDTQQHPQQRPQERP